MNLSIFGWLHSLHIQFNGYFLQGEALNYQLIPTMSWLKLTRSEMKKGIHILTMIISHQQSDATWNRSRRLTCRSWPKLPTSHTGTASRTSTSTWQTSASTTTSPKLALANIAKLMCYAQTIVCWVYPALCWHVMYHFIYVAKRPIATSRWYLISKTCSKYSDHVFKLFFGCPF